MRFSKGTYDHGHYNMLNYAHTFSLQADVEMAIEYKKEICLAFSYLIGRIRLVN